MFESPQSYFTDMNRLSTADSNLSLDLCASAGDPAGMIAQPYQLYVERTDPARNMARYSTMSIDETLFGDVCLTRRWGRIGARGRTMHHHFEREEDAVVQFLDVLRQRQRRGYRPRMARTQPAREADHVPQLREPHIF
ncbi:WGR domain-containing protein [Neorhizobium sp. DT-125]|uniref:WGR domain-containing protein n=1 Tax=Neorhizobium sp. DT-125 TaxID=3396163 RepID=UPI003F1A8D2F